MRHGHAIEGKQSPEYRAWQNMKNRCYNPKMPNFNIYGGRGITVHPTWIDSFDNFLKDMGLRPSPKHTLERTNNNGHYAPDNCQWATRKEQSYNRRNNVFTKKEVDEIRQLWNQRIYDQTELAKIYGVKPNQISEIVRNKHWV